MRWLDLFYPPLCANCHRIGAWLCSSCQKQLQIDYVTQTRPLAYPGLKKVWSAVIYNELAAKILEQTKFRGYRVYATIMAKIMIRELSQNLSHTHIDVLIPVPIHPKRLRERGFNQAELVAKKLSRAWRIPCDLQALRRQTYRQKQSLSSGKVARRNVEYDFSAQAPEIFGKTVCLVDDVLTTGATLGACARALEPWQPKQIIAVTFARAQ